MGSLPNVPVQSSKENVMKLNWSDLTTSLAAILVASIALGLLLKSWWVFFFVTAISVALNRKLWSSEFLRRWR
jgi:nucleoside recognition membrane protein YjiH